MIVSFPKFRQFDRHPQLAIMESQVAFSMDINSATAQAAVTLRLSELFPPCLEEGGEGWLLV